MPPYGDHARQHGVIAYEIAPDSIDVAFTSGWIYHFSYANPGELRVERMKTLAQSGKGLSTFISKHVKNRFESRRRSEDRSLVGQLPELRVDPRKTRV